MNDRIHEQAQQQFAKNANNYVNSPLHAKGADLSWLVSSSNAGPQMEVLDIATGGGHVANALAPLVRRVTAYDLTEEMLAAAAHFIRANGHLNVDFTAGAAERLPFKDASFDLVTCRIAAHHFSDIPCFASEAFRVLKPGSKLLLIDNVAPEVDQFDHFYNEVEKQRDPSHVRVWKKSEWVNLLEKTGYRIETIVSFPKTFQFQDWCERAGLPAEEQARLATKLLQASQERRDFFSIRTSDSGDLLSFDGEAAYFQCRRDRMK
ncbi:MAG: SAM-dependent methyltransferase [Bacilli bacterium]|nr:SAM-dependent methyltransferase [Bacilli bacterium]